MQSPNESARAERLRRERRTPCYQNGRGDQSTWFGRALLLLTAPALIMAASTTAYGVRFQYLAYHATNPKEAESIQRKAIENLFIGTFLSVISLMIIGCTSHSISDTFRVLGKGIRYILCCGNTGNTRNELDELESQREDFERRLHSQAEAEALGVERQGAIRER